MTVFSWNFGDPDVADINEFSDVVTRLPWSFHGTRQDASDPPQDVVVTRCGVLEMEPPETGSAFVPFADLTVEEIEAWASSGLPVDAFKMAIEAELDAIMAPRACKPLPWTEDAS